MSELYYDNFEEKIEGEEWKQHPIHTAYEGSNLGRIRNKASKKIKKQYLHPDGRYVVSLSYGEKTKNIKTHRFIIECFKGLAKENLECDHINSKPIDNRIKNLRWVTRKENMNNPNSKSKYKPSKTTNKTSEIECYNLDGSLFKTFNSIKEASLFIEPTKRHRTVCSNIAQCLNGENRVIAYGYKWKYSEQKLLDGEYFKKHPTLDIMVSNFGRVKFLGKRKHKRITFGHIGKDGYCYIEEPNVRKKFRVHRLVAELFIPNPYGKEVVNHINTNRSYNRVENLEWCTKQENMLSRETHKKTSKPIDVFNEDDILIKNFNSIRECCREMNLSRSCVTLVIKNKKEFHKGYKFKIGK